jgi:oxaloacetate decarboxylase gamma subunit
MIMVFLILFLVVGVGNVVIMLTNRYVPASEKLGKGGAVMRSRNPKKLAVIAAVVEVITHGKGRVDSIQKK